MKNKVEKYFDGKDTLEKLTGYYRNGNVYYEIYFLNDKYHRTDGPAFIDYNEDGRVYREEYYLNGIRFYKKVINSKLTRKMFPNHIVDGEYLYIED